MLTHLLLTTTTIASALSHVHPRRLPSRLAASFRHSSPPVMSRPDVARPYHPPAWAKEALARVPAHGRLHLANLPTPLQRVGSAGARGKGILSRLEELDITLYVKRDDATGGSELGGNKVRKLEFLLADALAQGCDSVVTIGGEQSNHCRATAAASRMVGLSPHLILRTRRAEAIHNKEEDLGWTGNVLFDRMVGSKIYTCTPGEYGRLGSDKLVAGVCDHLKSERGGNRTPYAIPVGGSNAVGTWGYINGVDELMQQMEDLRSDDPDFALDHVVFATGSGGTATGIALSLLLAYGSLGGGCHPTLGKAPQVHAVGVCDDPDYFYHTMAAIADDMGLRLPTDMTAEGFLRDGVTVHQGKGRGYAVSVPGELDFLRRFATEVGIALDPVYSGKALYHFLTKVVEEEPERYRGKNILFWHTGGSLGLYEKGDDLLEGLSMASPVKRIDAYGTTESGDDNVVPI